MTAVPDPPMRLAYLGDPNEVHTRRWLTFFVARGHQVHLLVRNDTVLESPLPDGIVLERMDPFDIRWYRPDSYRRPVGPSGGCSSGSMPRCSTSTT